MPRIDPIKRIKYNEKYYSKNENRIKKILKKWYLKNKEKRKERYKENSKINYYKDKKKKMARVMAYQKIKLKTDINWILRKRLRNRLQKALKGVTKSKKTMDLLGVPHMDFFKTWIECKFKEGMTWENRRLWHVDHILPCSSFDLTKPEEQAKCFHYTNLQPLWASENLSKGNRIS